MPRLIVIKGTDEGKQFELTGTALTVGREARNPIRLHDTEISRRHAEFRRTTEGYRLFDLASANGTFVNSQAIKDVLLQPGDQIQIGQSVLVYIAGRDETARAATRPSVSAWLPGMISSCLPPSSRRLPRVKAAAYSLSRSRPREPGSRPPWSICASCTRPARQSARFSTSASCLERIMDLIFRSIEADRGCIMLLDPETGQFQPQAVHWRNPIDPQEKMAVSRTIMDHVLHEKQGVLVADATRDERFSAGQSIVRFGIREVICVPMKGRHKTLGVLYLDTRSPNRADARFTPPAMPETPLALDADSMLSITVAAGALEPAGDSLAPATTKFTEDHLALAIAIAHQAALAVEDTRYHHAMVQAERLAAVGQTIAALSHHIKNILQGLRSGGDIVKMGLADKNDALLQQGWKIVEKNQAKIYELVLDMLSYSKDREPIIEEIDVNRITQDVLELAQGRAQECGIRLESRLDGSLPHAQADPEGVHRSLLNLVTNALDAVADREHPQVGVVTTLEADGQWVRITVLDNGVGIPQDKLEDIFKPFISSKGARGTGLGLAVSRKIIREHGGDIMVQSQLGKGSRFILRLPLKSLATPGRERGDSGTPGCGPVGKGNTRISSPKFSHGLNTDETRKESRMSRRIYIYPAFSMFPSVLNLCSIRG